MKWTTRHSAKGNPNGFTFTMGTITASVFRDFQSKTWVLKSEVLAFREPLCDGSITQAEVVMDRAEVMLETAIKAQQSKLSLVFAQLKKKRLSPQDKREYFK